MKAFLWNHYSKFWLGVVWRFVVVTIAYMIISRVTGESAIEFLTMVAVAAMFTLIDRTVELHSRLDKQVEVFRMHMLKEHGKVVEDDTEADDKPKDEKD